MKPSWKDAPDWAKWAAMDNFGNWYWYESKPKKNLTAFSSHIGSRVEKMCTRFRWEDSLEGRPGDEE